MDDYAELFLISDANGRQIELRRMDEGFDLWHGEVRFGHVYFTLTPGLMELHDFLIRDDLPQQPTTFWARLFGTNKMANYRNQGLGYAIILFLKDYAKKRGVRHIEGHL